MLLRTPISIATLAFSVALSACGAGQPITGPNASALSTAETAASKPAPEKSPCGGSNGEIITPCPVRLTRANGKSGVTITISGPNVANAVSGDRGCQFPTRKHSGVCGIEQQGFYSTQFLVTAGPHCGSLVQSLDGMNSERDVIGSAYAKVTNRDC
jgi:hypothetical protein